MDQEFMKFLATLGVGGVLAGVIFFFYRKDVRLYTDLWKSQTELLVIVVKENTSSNIQLVGMIQSLHKRIDFMDEDRAMDRRDRDTIRDRELLRDRARDARERARDERDLRGRDRG